MKISKKESLNIVVVAAEASSASYATDLMKKWNQKGIDYHCAGIGNREMESMGFQILGRTEELAVVGLQEIIAHWKDIKKAFYAILEYVQKEKPDFVLLMDYPEFNLRLAQKLKKLGIPVVYYISPQIWAWRTYRVHKIKKIIDLMLVIFPFEVDFYKKYGVPVEFVGHPLIEMLSQKEGKMDQAIQLRQELLKQHTNILGLMPGSRKSELKFNLQVQIETAHKITKKHPHILPVIFVAPSLDIRFVEEQCQQWKFQGQIVKMDPFVMIQTADEVLCASGTATLMVALCKKPMVIMYKMNAISAFLAKKLVRHIPFFGMVNLILGRESVHEKFQEQASATELSRCLLEIIESPSRREQILDDLKQLKIQLGEGNGIEQLSQALLKFSQKTV